MLTELHINNFAIIDDLKIPFDKGLNILTGETGAGKSIIVEALNLVSGDKVLKDVIRSGKSEASVVALFDLGSSGGELKNIFKEMGLDIQDECFLKRIVSNSGKSKAYINGTPISLSELKKISPYFVEISSQHEHQRLIDEKTHLSFVDLFGSTQELCREFKEKYDNYVSLKSELEELERLSFSAEEQREYLSFQLKEIDRANLKKGEDRELENEKSVVKHFVKLHESMKNIENLLFSGEDSATSLLDRSGRFFEAAIAIDSTVQEMGRLSSEAQVALQELSRQVEEYLDRLDLDPSRLEEIEARLFEIHRLQKKHGPAIEDILDKRGKIFTMLTKIENCDDEIKKLKEKISRSEKELKERGEALSKKRAESAARLSKLVQNELDTLGMKRTTFDPGQKKLDFSEVCETGLDFFQFEISPNLGEPLKPLAQIASGGELSRIMLAVKNILMESVGFSMLEVFDEIDVGIGGAVAEVVGKKLKQMALGRQIICITHLPQVASFGDRHIMVLKTAKARRTVTEFRILDEQSRVEEIARMLGGATITKTTKEHAQEMLSRSS